MPLSADPMSASLERFLSVPAKTLSRGGCLLLLLVAVPAVLGHLARQFVLDSGGAFNVDSPVFWTVGRGLAGGLQPYRDLYEVKPPGIFLVGALSYRLTGGMGLGHFLYAVAVLLPTALYALFSIRSFRRHALPDRLLFAGLTVAFVGLVSLTTAHLALGFFVEPFGLAFVALYGLLVGLWTPTSGWRWLAAAAFALFGAVGFKEPFVLVALAVAAIHASKPRDLVWTFGVPCLLAALAGVASMAALGYLGDYVSVYLPHLLGHHVQRAGPAVWARGTELVRLFAHFDDLPGALHGMKWTVPLLVGQFVTWGGTNQSPRGTWLAGLVGGLLFLTWTFRARDATSNGAVEAGILSACLAAYCVAAWRPSSRKIAVLAALLPPVALLAWYYLGVNEGPLDAKLVLARAYVAAAAVALVALLGLPLGREDRRLGLLVLAAFSAAFLYAAVESVGLPLYLFAPWVARGRVGPLLALAFASLVLARGDRPGFDALWRVGRVFIAGYLLTLAFGLGGVYVGGHFIFALGGLLALFQDYLARRAADPAPRAPSLAFASVLLSILTAVAVGHDGSPFLRYQAQMQEQTRPARQIAEQADAILDRCGKGRYLYLGHSGPPVFAFTRHSPLGPYFYQSPVLVGNQAERLYRTTRENLRQADLVVLVDLSLKAMTGEADAYLREHFTTRPWECAGAVEAVDTRGIGVGYDLLFRTGG